MQLFSSIHTISSWVNSLAVRPASFSHFWKSHLHGYICSRGNPAMSNGTQPRVAVRSKNNTQRPFEGGGAGLRALRRDWLRQGVVPRRGVSCGSAERGRLTPGSRPVGWRSGWWKTQPLCASAEIALTKTSRPRLPHLGVLQQGRERLVPHRFRYLALILYKRR